MVSATGTPGTTPAAPASRPPEDRRPPDRDDDRDRYDDRGRKRKKRGFLDDLFDFD